MATPLFANLESDPNSAEDLDAAPKDVPFTQAEGFEPPKGPKRRNTRIRTEVHKLYAAAGLAVFPFDQFIGTQIMECADNCADAWDELAATNPAVKRALESLIQTSSYGTLIAAHMPLVVAVATKYVPQLREAYEGHFTEGQPE